MLSLALRKEAVAWPFAMKEATPGVVQVAQETMMEATSAFLIAER